MAQRAPKDASRDHAHRAQSLRQRIRTDEHRLSICYPEEEQELREEIERSENLLRELEEQIPHLLVENEQELREVVDRYFALRHVRLALLGHFYDPPFVETPFGAMDTLSTKAMLLNVTEMEQARPAETPQVDVDHRERVKNERAGRGYYTDAELSRLRSEDEFQVRHGAGAKLVK
jgi:hypothetical protein